MVCPGHSGNLASQTHKQESTMLPDPLHPLIVHFPIVLVTLLPLSAIGALWLIRRGSGARKAWTLPLGLAVALALSAWVATETGEQQEDRVERVVGERPLHSHEEAAELFLLLSGGMVALAAAGLAPGRIGKVARATATVGALALVGAGVQVGRTGGDLVYRHGAASAYTSPESGSAIGEIARGNRGGDDDDDRRDH
jgi:uncharacterized membrane protein